MEIDGDIVMAATEAKTEEQIGQQMTPRCDDDVVEVRIRGDDRRGERFDEIRQMGAGKTLPESTNRRRRENDVADFPQTNQKNTFGELVSR